MEPQHDPLQQPVPDRSERWLKVGLGVGFLLIIAWLYFSSSRTIAPVAKAPAETNSPAVRRTPDEDAQERTTDDAIDSGTASRKQPSRSNNSNEAATPDDPLIVHSARVTNEDGRVIHRGDVDLRPTIDRIERGKRLRFSHDGSVFENRERRLPTKPSGYYREFIHPTSDNDGPGGQRVVVGREGEIYYTPDHYKTFRRVR